MKTDNFFEESSEQSKVKSAIVSKYFVKWSQIIMRTQDNYSRYEQQLAYIDLFAGPGRYKDGTKSTPLLILEKAIQDETLRQRLVTIFNDRDENNTQSLEKAINELPNIETLKHAPVVQNNEIGIDIIKSFEQRRLIPTLFFIDPWGYKGLSLKLVDTAVKDWGCDCIFFFNYNRINMGLGNYKVEQHMNDLFGENRADKLREKMQGLNADERELEIVEEICQAIKDMGRQFVLPFGFKSESGTRTKHHLIFVSKNVRGYEVMKEVMASESSEVNDGVASFGYSPASERQPLLFTLTQPLEILGEMLLKDFAGHTLKMQEVYERHHVGKRYIKKNYKMALSNLHDAGLVSVTTKRRKGTFGDDVVVTFSPPINNI